MSGVTYKIQGLKDVLAAFEELAADIGDKKARSKILVPAAREAMKPVLTMAKMNAPKDSGDLSRTMQIEARLSAIASEVEKLEKLQTLAAQAAGNSASLASSGRHSPSSHRCQVRICTPTAAAASRAV